MTSVYTMIWTSIDVSAFILNAILQNVDFKFSSIHIINLRTFRVSATILLFWNFWCYRIYKHEPLGFIISSFFCETVPGVSFIYFCLNVYKCVLGVHFELVYIWHKKTSCLPQWFKTFHFRIGFLHKLNVGNFQRYI